MTTKVLQVKDEIVVTRSTVNKLSFEVKLVCICLIGKRTEFLYNGPYWGHRSLSTIGLENGFRSKEKPSYFLCKIYSSSSAS